MPTPIYGFNLGSPISPGTAETDTYTHEDLWGRGGLMVVSSITALTGITLQKQKIGMIVFSQDTSLYYAVTSISFPLTGYTPLISLSGGLLKSGSANVDLGQIPSLSGNWNTAYNNAIYTINGTANQIVATSSGNNTGNNSYTLSLPNNVLFPGSVTVDGNFTVNGSATFINTNNLVVNDNIIYLNQGAIGNTLDTGFVSHFTPTSGNYNHTGLIRRAGQGTPGTWTLFSGLTTEPLTSSNINWSDTTFTLDTLNANINAPTVNTNNLNVAFDYPSVPNTNNAVWTSKDSSRNWYSIAMSSDGTRQTAVNKGGYIYVSTDSGNSWTPKITDASRQWISVAMSTDGRIQTAVATGSQIYVSYDYGTSWDPKDTTRDWQAITVSSDGTKQTAIVGGGYIYVSSNSGATWTATATDSTRSWYKVAMSSDGTNQVAVVLGGYIYTSSDSGASWIPDTRYSKNWTGVTISSDGLRITATAIGERIYVSTNFGSTWTIVINYRQWLSVAMTSDGSTQIAITSSNLGDSIWISRNYGVSWNQLSPNISIPGLRDIAISSDGSTITAVAISNYIYVSPKIYSTTRGGSLSAVSAFVTTLTANSAFVSQLTCANTIYANGGNSNLWNSAYNTVNIINSNYVQDAQSNNLLYARYNGSWVAFTPGTPYNQTLNTFDNVLFSNLTIANSISSNSIISKSVNSNSVNSLVCNTTNLSSNNFSSTNITGTNYFGTFTTKKIILNSFPSNAQNITSGLMAYWSFNTSSGGNPLYDNTGNGNTLTNRGAVLVEGIFDGLQIPATTLFDGAHSFNNSSMFATYSEPYTSFDFSGDFGISFWIKPKTSATNSIQPIIYGENYSNFYSNYYYGGINITLQNNTIIVSDYTNANDPATQDSTILTSSSQLSSNIWSHIVITRNAGDIALYIDGVKVGESSTVIDYSCQQLYFGAYSDNIINDGLTYGNKYTPFIGVMDEIGLWTRGLTIQEITALYNNRNGATYPFNYQLNLSLGGTIDTTGQGAIEFGQDGNKTTLVGTASGDITIRLPSVSGTLITDSILNPDNANSVYSTVQNTSANWQSVYSTVQNTSANWQSVYSTVRSTSANWQSVYSTVQNTSANWQSVYSTVQNTSANWQSVYSTVRSTSANWQSVYSTVQNTSANWNSVYTFVTNNSGGWGSSNATISLPQSANWNSVYNTVSSLSSGWGSGTIDAAVRSLTGNWQNVYSFVAANSSLWGIGGVGGTTSALTSSYVFTGNGSVSSFNLGSTIPLTAASNYIVSLNGVLQTPYNDYNITYNNGTNYLNTLFVPRNNSTISVISINNSSNANLSNTNVSFSTVSASQFYGNASTANKLVSSVTISLVGSIVGSASFDGSNNITITTTGSAGSVATTGVGLSSKRIINSGNVNQTLKYQTYLIDTRSNSVTANLPLSAQPGDFIAYQDMYRTWNKNNFVINNTTYKLQGFNEPMICNLPGLTISLTYLDDTLGWYVD